MNLRIEQFRFDRFFEFFQILHRFFDFRLLLLLLFLVFCEFIRCFLQCAHFFALVSYDFFEFDELTLEFVDVDASQNRLRFGRRRCEIGHCSCFDELLRRGQRAIRLKRTLIFEMLPVLLVEILVARFDTEENRLDFYVGRRIRLHQYSSSISHLYSSIIYNQELIR